MHKSTRGILGYIVIILLFIMVATVLFGDRGNIGERIEYNQFLDHVKNKQIGTIAIRESSKTLYGLYKGSRIPAALLSDHNCDFYAVFGSDLYETLLGMRARELGRTTPEGAVSPTSRDVLLTDLDFTIIQLPPVQPNWFLEFLPYLILLVIMILFWWFMMRQQMGANNKALSFGKSRARMADSSKNKVTFADVAGADEEKEELREIVDFLKNPKQYVDLGARIPKGVLLVGPPGTGKTLLAKAVAGEANVPFYSISGSDFVEMFVGVGASRVRDLFDQAKRSAPSIVFIDEIDAVGRRRGAGLGGGHDEREQTLNQLLVEMDGFTTNEGVIVIAATNRRDILDPALLRPGRFDRQVTVHYPDLAGRVAILKVHAKGKPLGEDVDLENIAKRTPFSTGADLENIMNEAALLAARTRSPMIDQNTLINAVERIQMGPEKRSHKVLERDKRIIAFHEAGHAVVAYLLPLCDDVHLITIMPRGRTGGHTLLLPDQEPDLNSRAQLLQQVSMALGGHAAESIALGDIHTGSSSDLQRATEMCRTMVTHFGMSDKLGTIFLGNDQEIFVGMEFGQAREYSEEVAASIDKEVKRLLDECYAQTCELIKAHLDDLTSVAEALIERETINRADFERLMRGETLETPVIPQSADDEPASGAIDAPWNAALDENQGSVLPQTPEREGAPS